MKKMKGLGVSGGIAIGSACILRETNTSYEKQSSLTPDKERVRFEAALARFAESTHSAANELRERVGDHDAAILEGHLLMLQDPVLRGEIDGMIEKGATAEHAAAAVLESYIIVFTASEDDLTCQRAADIRDIKTELLAILQEKPTARITLPEAAILVTEELTPSVLAKLANTAPIGILTAGGSITSHAAILAKTMGIPAVFSIEGGIDPIAEGDTIILDGSSGCVILTPDDHTAQSYTSRAAAEKDARSALKAFADKPTQSADGRTFHLFCNIGIPDEASLVKDAGGEGIGLMRSEFLFMERSRPPDEEEQYQAYKAAAEAMEGKPVIIRTLDIGGDKAIPYLGIEREENPFLGHRAIRYCLKQEALFKTQLRAILRASAHGDVRIMLPLIISPEEIRAAKAILEACREELSCSPVPLGIMIETPAAVLIADILAREADFFSIGTNDLTQYILTADRGNPATAPLYDPFHPAVLRALRHTIKAAKAAGIPVGMCGEAAADPRMIPLLMAMELDEFSTSPSILLACRAEIAKWRLSDAKTLLDRVMAAESFEEVHAILQK